MNDVENQKIAANYMGAIAHALCGKPGRHREFIHKVEVLLSGSEPDAMRLLQHSGRVRTTGRPLIWIHHAADVPNVPQIGLVVEDDGKLHVIESCMLWSPTGRGRMLLVPDSFQAGSFRFDDRLRLRHRQTPPAPTFDAGTPGMVRAYERVRRLEAMQREQGEAFDLPTLFSRRQAA